MIKFSKKSIFLLVIIVVLLIFANLALTIKNLNILNYDHNKQNEMIFNNKLNFTLTNVPYVGKHSHVNENAYLRNSVDSSIFAVLKYFDKQKSSYAVAQSVSNWVDNTYKINGLLSAEIVLTFFENEPSLDAEIKDINIFDIADYFGPDKPSPLLTQLPVSLDQPDELNYYPFVLVVGVDTESGIIIIHDYWRGAYRTVPIVNYIELKLKMPKKIRDNYIVFSSDKNLNLPDVNSESNDFVRADGEFLSKNQDFMELFALGAGAEHVNSLDSYGPIYGEIVNNRDFDTSLPNFFKVYALSHYVDYLLSVSELERAEILIEKALTLNMDFDKPFLDWPGYEVRFNQSDIIDRISSPHRIYADLLKEKGEYEEAKIHYEEALRIFPYNGMAKFGLEEVNSFIID
jgi:tetratricopeptide (TPR) repeat protein